MRVVLDTNLVVRAAGGPTGLGRELLRLAISEPHSLLLSHSLYAEIRKVMHYPHVRAFHRLDDAEIQSFLDHLVTAAEPVNIGALQVGPLIGVDPTDDTVLLTAVVGSAEWVAARSVLWPWEAELSALLLLVAARSVTTPMAELHLANIRLVR